MAGPAAGGDRRAGRAGRTARRPRCDGIERRFPDHPAVAGVRTGLSAVDSALAAIRTPRTVVHGDYWPGNLLLHRGRVSGVVDWESGALAGEPLRDVVRFVLSYAL